MSNLKRVLSIAVLALLAAIPASAQTNLGVIAGLSLSKVVAEPPEGIDFSNTRGLALGGVISRPLGGGLELQLEPMYIQKGSEVDVTGFNETVKVESEYIDVPVLFKVAFGKGGVKPYVIGGPTFAYLLTGKQTASFIPAEQEDVEQDTAAFDFGLTLGGGVTIPMGRHTVFFEGRYGWGISNSDSDDSATDHTQSIKNRGVVLLAGVTFPIGH